MRPKPPNVQNVEWLREAYRQTNKRGASGIDGVTAQEYGANLEENLQSLHERLKVGRYKASPVERVWLEKEDKRKRPIGKPTFEDKIVQRGVAMLLEAIYEQDVYEFSYGFRKGHSAHQALQALREQCREMNISWIVDADVSGFFDEIPHNQLREMWCKDNYHEPIGKQYQMLCLKLRGHYQYYGVRSNYHQLEAVYQQTLKSWWYWLRRRNRKRDLSWEQFLQWLKHFPLPRPRIIHAI